MYRSLCLDLSSYFIIYCSMEHCINEKNADIKKNLQSRFGEVGCGFGLRPLVCVPALLRLVLRYTQWWQHVFVPVNKYLLVTFNFW